MTGGRCRGIRGRRTESEKEAVDLGTRGRVEEREGIPQAMDPKVDMQARVDVGAR